jgi:signal transduction histidine kinase
VYGLIQRAHPVSDRLADIGLGFLVAGVVIALRVFEVSTRHLAHAGSLGLAIAIASALTLILRRRWPLLVAALTLGAVPVVIALDRASGAISLPAIVAVYTVATLEPRRRAVLVAAASASMVALARGFIQAKGWSDARTAAEPALVIAALFLGWAIAGRRAYNLEVRDRAARAEAAREAEMRRRVDAERLRIARELHDVVAHTIATINVQAGVAAHVIDKQPEAAAQALETIKTTSREALRELRSILGVLRAPADEESRAPAPGLAQLDALIATSDDAGLPVRVEVSGERRPLPPTVDLAAYRIVQESLTNVLRHAGQATAAVRLAYAPDELAIEVTDTGRGAGAVAGTGHGIAGMRERVSALHGELEAASLADGGFRVRARLPLGGDA